MNSGLTQVVMLGFRVKDPSKRAHAVKVRVSYYDVVRRQQVHQDEDVVLTVNGGRDHCDTLADSEVRKNATIAELAQSLFDMSESARQQQHRHALDVLNASVSAAYRRYPNMEDADLRFIVNIVEGYRRDLQAFQPGPDRRDCGTCR